MSQCFSSRPPTPAGALAGGPFSLLLLVAAVWAGCGPEISVDAGAGGGGGGGGGGSGGGGQPACVPEPEICDGRDNDCDGQVDDLPAAVACDTGLLGICGLGSEHCSAGVAVCIPSAEAYPEACDGLDNDCNGLVDDDVVAGAECDTGQLGVCAAGSAQCVAGSWICTPLQEPSPAELCDGLDNDCDGMVDEDCCCIPGYAPQCYTGPPNTVDVGECHMGTQQCTDDCAWGPCEGEQTPQPELCDGLDNDCNGLTDDNCT